MFEKTVVGHVMTAKAKKNSTAIANIQIVSSLTKSFVGYAMIPGKIMFK